MCPTKAKFEAFLVPFRQLYTCFLVISDILAVVSTRKYTLRIVHNSIDLYRSSDFVLMHGVINTLEETDQSNGK